MASMATAIALDIAIWRYGLPYPVFGWLPSWFGADGEAAYDLHVPELALELFVIYAVIAVTIDRIVARKLAARTR